MVALAIDGVAPFELAVGCEVFGIDRSDLASPWYRFIVAAVTPPSVQTSVGYTIQTPFGLEALKQADTVFIPAKADRRALYDEAYEAIRAAHRRGRA